MYDYIYKDKYLLIQEKQHLEEIKANFFSLFVATDTISCITYKGIISRNQDLQ